MRVVLRCFLSFFLFLKEENKRENCVRLCDAGWSQPLEVKPRDRNRGSGRTTASVKKPLYVVDRGPRWFRMGWREGFGRDMNKELWNNSTLYLNNTFFPFVRIAVKAPKNSLQMQCTFPIPHQRFLCPQSLLQSPLKLELQPYCLIVPMPDTPELGI